MTQQTTTSAFEFTSEEVHHAADIARLAIELGRLEKTTPEDALQRAGQLLREGLSHVPRASALQKAKQRFEAECGSSSSTESLLMAMREAARLPYDQLVGQPSGKSAKAQPSFTIQTPWTEDPEADAAEAAWNAETKRLEESGELGKVTCMIDGKEVKRPRRWINPNPGNAKPVIFKWKRLTLDAFKRLLKRYAKRTRQPESWVDAVTGELDTEKSLEMALVRNLSDFRKVDLRDRAQKAAASKKRKAEKEAEEAEKRARLADGLPEVEVHLPAKGLHRE